MNRLPRSIPVEAKVKGMKGMDDTSRDAQKEQKLLLSVAMPRDERLLWSCGGYFK
jgi:hypothetical protein